MSAMGVFSSTLSLTKVFALFFLSLHRQQQIKIKSKIDKTAEPTRTPTTIATHYLDSLSTDSVINFGTIITTGSVAFGSHVVFKLIIPSF